jgi:hypothetical protein
MNENVEVRFSRLERAPAYKTVVAPWLAITIGGYVRRKAGEISVRPSAWRVG